MSARQARRRHSYGRRLHSVRERRNRFDSPSSLLDDPGSAGGGELGTDRLRRPDIDLKQPPEASR